MWRSAPCALALMTSLLAGCEPEPTPVEPTRDCGPDPVLGDVVGQVDDLSHDPIVLAGAVVSEWGCEENETQVGDDGLYAMTLQRADRPIIRVSYPAFLPVVVGIAAVDRDRGIEVSMYSREDEIAFSIEDFGVPYDPAYGGLLVHFFTGIDAAASPATAGAWADIDLEYGTVWGLDTTDEHVMTQTVPAGASSAEIWFHTVAPGMATLDLRPPDGAVCTGPETLPVFADTYTHANVYCEVVPE